MKKHLIAAALILAALTSPAKSKTYETSEIKAAAEAIETHPGVISTLQENSKNFWVEMETSGVDRFEFSKTVCGQLPKGISLTIHIIDTATLKMSKYHCVK